MTSQVLYRKWRPRRLDEVVGQEPITRTLSQAIAQERWTHAYLFCGPRGTGKTSTARILAKAINCLAPAEGEPCNACPPCAAVNEGRAVDLIEIDAASNRSIDDIRSLRERVHFAPSESRFKVYIIDEVHMLTPEAFNALLKTLEEPPPHIVMILATTEAHKVPATIISRCQRFDFHRIHLEAVVQRLRQICESEGVQATDEALRVIARAATGSLRDATNVLERLIVSYGAEFGLDQLRDLLGTGDEQRALELASHALRGQVSQGLAVINAVATQGQDLRQFQRLVVDYLRAALLIQSGAKDTLDLPVETLAELQEATSAVSLGHVLRAVKLFGQAGMRLDTPSPLPLELALVECTLTESKAEEKPLAVAASPQPPPRHVGESSKRAPRPSLEPPPVAADSPRPVAAQESSPTPEPVPVPADLAQALEERWEALVKSLQRKKGRRFFLGALLRDCRSHRLEGQDLVLGFQSRSNMERMQEEMATPEGRRILNEGLKSILGMALEIRVELAGQANEQGAGGNTDPGHLVRAALRLGGRIIEDGGEQQ